MTDEQMKQLAELVTLLKPIQPEERHRLVNAALALLGNPPITVASASRIDEESALELNPRARSWTKQHGILDAHLAQVFHFSDGAAELIADVPGSNAKEKTLNAYVFTGVLALLNNGQPAFEDKVARALCKQVGCFSDKHHSEYIDAKGNELAGSRADGWSVTTPGLKRAAALVKLAANIDADADQR